jgi:hypothetical protein
MRGIRFFSGFLIFVSASQLFAQYHHRDVIYLSDGSIVRGSILFSNSNDSLRVETEKDSLVVIEKINIHKIQRERYQIINGEELVIFKHPGYAMLFSFLMPGLGQFYNGEYLKGIVQQSMVLGGITLALTAGLNHDSEDFELFTEWFIVGEFLVGAGYFFSIIDAPISANRINREHQSRYGHLIEINSSNNVLGMDFLTTRNRIGVEVICHF